MAGTNDYPFELEVKDGVEYDPVYPGTAVGRLRSVLQRVRNLENLDGAWPDVRRLLLAAGGLKEDFSTSHAFNDDNHCDLTTMVDGVSHNSNADGAVSVISRRNQLGPHIQKASLPGHGKGGSWSTCTNGAHMTPPRDVAHVQFSSRVAFKLVWVPPNFEEFVLHLSLHLVEPCWNGSITKDVELKRCSVSNRGVMGNIHHRRNLLSTKLCQRSYRSSTAVRLDGYLLLGGGVTSAASESMVYETGASCIRAKTIDATT